MFQGYLELGGVPIVNAEATEAYVDHMAPGIALNRMFRTDKVHAANEEPAYRTPVLDEAPWVDVNDSATHGFLGLYPLSVEGIDDSTVAAPVTEYLSSGGGIGRQRDASRPIRVSGLLVGTSGLAAQAGLTWLQEALRSEDCTSGNCVAGELRYFIAEPDVCEIAFGKVASTSTVSLGDSGPDTFRYRWTVDQADPNMPAVARWEALWSEGTTIQYGAAELTSLEQSLSDPVQPLRRNYVVNPTFRTGLSGWGVNGGTATWVSTGGSDGGGFARFAGTGPVTRGLGYGEGGYGEGGYGGSTSTAASLLVAGAAAPAPAGPITASVDVRGFGASVRLEIHVSGSVAALASTTVVGTDHWQRVSLTGTLATASGVSIVVYSTSTVDLDGALVEAGSFASPYFDGETVEPGFTISWEGAPDASVARRVWTDPAQVTRADSRFRPTLVILEGSAIGLQLAWDVRPRLSMMDQLEPYERTLYDVAMTQGPQVIAQYDLGPRGSFIQVDFALTAGNPFAYSLPVSVNTTPLANAAFVDPDSQIALVDDSWLADPNSIVTSLPPTAPSILNPAIESISSWQRYYVPIPAAAVGDWSSSIPSLDIVSHATPITQVRVRFHPNPFGYTVQQVDPLSYCSEFVVSYLPAQTKLQVDGVLERATASRGDKAPINADHLLYGTNGGPLTWPALSCGIDYVMTIDVPPTGAIDQFEVDLQMRKKR